MSNHTFENIPLRDSHQREFSYLRLSVTDLCNFKCDYCLPNGYQGKKKNNELSLQEIKTLVAGFAETGFKKIRITGGEPSLRKDLIEIISICKQQKGIEKVCITTNGYQLKKFLPAWIEAGIDQVTVSIDSLNPASFKAITSSNDLPNILSAIDSAHSNQFTAIKINTVLLREHIDTQFLPLIDWVKDKPLSLRFIELMQTGNNHEYFDQQYVSSHSITQHLINTQWQEKPRDLYAGPAREYIHKESLGSIGIIAPYEKNFCGTCNRLRVSANGNLHLCLFAEESLSLRPFLSDEDTRGLIEFLNVSINNKLPSHLLHQRKTGVTQHFSMIGG